MRKIGEVLEEIEQMEYYYKVISNISNKMAEDSDIRKYMMDTFKVDTKTMDNIASKFSIRISKIKNSLNECEVDID